jgi:curved DNA-binding protein CbpA
MDHVQQAYRLLGLPAGATMREVTKAYRLLAKKYHPDSNPGGAQAQTQSQNMMMRINDAYQTVKQFIAQGGGAETLRPQQESGVRHRPPSGRRSSGREGSDAVRRAQEQYRREREGFNRWWQERLDERRREDEDQNAYRIVVKHTFGIIADLYGQRLHYPFMRERPAGSIAYETFLGKFEILMEKSRKLSKGAGSKHYRRKFALVLDFLEVFLDHLEDSGVDSESRASALHRYGDAVRDRDNFMAGFFSDPNIDRAEAIEELKRALGSFEEFIEAYPDSPLLGSADVTVDLLQGVYRAFLKGNGVGA